MEKVKIYQIGLGSFGRHGFDKLVELSKEFDKLELCGVCDRDFERLDHAEQFASVNDTEVKTFQKIDELYREAQEQDEKIMIYDAGPTESHSEHIYRSMQNDFFHLSEKPPSMNRGDHIREKRFAEQGKAMWMVDFIERESPVVKKALELLEGEELESIKVFRESSAGIEKAIDHAARLGVKGGDILDKMVHEVYVLDMLEKTGQEIDIELEDAETEFFLPRSRGSESFSDIYSNKTREINYETATATTKAEFSSGETDISLHSSWMGLSREAMLEAQKIEGETGERFFDREFSEMNGTAYVNEEARFFVIEGTRVLAGDMLHGKLYDLESGEEIELEDYIHDQLYRIIEKAAFHAAGKDVEIVSEKEIDVFMNGIFDVKESVASRDYDYYDELSKASDKLKKMMVEDGKIIEAERSETIAG